MRISYVLLCLSFCSLAACGGGGDGGGAGVGGAVQQEATLLSNPALDGSIWAPVGAVPASISHGSRIRAGDSGLDRPVRGFVSFDLAALPAGAQIESAVLTLYQSRLWGAPYVGLGSEVRVDHVDLEGALDLADFDSPALQVAIGVISTDAVEEHKSLDVAAQVQADLDAGRSSSEYRVYFPIGTENNGVSDQVRFDDADDAEEVVTVPTLVVTYSL